MAKRTDPHRPGAIVPSEYLYVLSYNLPSGASVPAYGINCEIDRRTWDLDERGNRINVKNGQHNEDGRCCVLKVNQSGVKWALTGDTGKCSVCGVHYVYGDIWEHKPTGEHLHIGHTCADKYQMLSDRSAWELALDRAKAATAREIQKKINAERLVKFMESHPGLEEALQTKHQIVENIRESFQKYRSLSDKQVALVFKLAAEAKLPPKEQEKTVPAPIESGRQTFEGLVVSAKTYEGGYGLQYKMCVKVTTPEGVWLAWGTAPQQLLDEVLTVNNQGRLGLLKGATVRVTATLRPGKDLHFAMMNRPHATIIEQGPIVKAAIAQSILEGVQFKGV